MQTTTSFDAVTVAADTLAVGDTVYVCDTAHGMKPFAVDQLHGPDPDDPVDVFAGAEGEALDPDQPRQRIAWPINCDVAVRVVRG